jgi:hypothetical protein
MLVCHLFNETFFSNLSQMEDELQIIHSLLHFIFCPDHVQENIFSNLSQMEDELQIILSLLHFIFCPDHVQDENELLYNLVFGKGCSQ